MRALPPFRAWAKKFHRLGLQYVGQFADDFQAGVKRPFFQLTKITATNAGLVGQRFLRQPCRVTQPTQIGREPFPQIHAETKAGCSIYYTSIY
jgi:hypothetical protein